MKKFKFSPALIPVVLWGILTLFSWFGPARDISEAERRPLAQRPSVSAQNIFSGKFMKDFEAFSLDQFPLRDSFRQLKSLVHTYLLGQKDNNGIYIAGDYAAKQEYPLDPKSLEHALERFNLVYESFLASWDSPVYMAVVPDKGYYLAEDSGHLAMDYDLLFATVRQGMPWAEHVDLTVSLGLEDYYCTDTHWRQEALLETAQTLCAAMGAPLPQEGDYTPVALERPFLGVYYGQAALPMEPETLYVLESELLKQCTVYDHETGKELPVYNLDMLWNRDPYDVFLSGAKSMLTVTNPLGEPGRELIIFRDSFGSSIAPLLLQGYSEITLVDIRYVQPGMLDRFLDFHGQEVLFLYSTLILNNSNTIK